MRVLSAAVAVAAASLFGQATPVAVAGGADPIRIATFTTELARRGPGLLLRDILKGDDPQVSAVVQVVAAADPDILLLIGVDYDAGGTALDALASRLAEAGAAYPYRFSLRPNAGIATGLDMDGNGRTGEPRDAQGYGAFAGQGGMALLSRLPVFDAAATDFSSLLWRDLPDANLPEIDGRPFPSAEALAIQRLSSVGHWIVPLVLPGGGQLNLMAFAAGPPVFDGSEDRNGKRNADEIRLWQAVLDGDLGAVPAPPFVILGDANLDPVDGDGLRGAMSTLLADPRLQDPQPSSQGGRAAGDPDHHGDPALDTADWPGGDEGGPGNLRVDYVLPSANLAVTGSGVLWPTEGPLAAAAATASRHRLVWVDILPTPPSVSAP